MTRGAVAAVALVAVAALHAPALAADDAAEYAALLDQKSPAVVTVKFVLKIQMAGGDEERNSAARGVVVDPAGLVMLSSDALEPTGGARLLRRQGGGGKVTFVPSDLKVLFGSEPKEHDAVLVAKESKLGLAFLQILAVDGALASLDLSKSTVEPKVGQLLAGVGRKSRGFDAAPVLERAFVTGRIEKPRPMWALSGTVSVGLPLYDLDGKAAGVVVQQRGVEGADDTSLAGFAAIVGETFLLPLDVVSKAIAQSKLRVPAVLERARAEKPADVPATADDAPTTTPGSGGSGAPGMGDAKPPTPAPGQPK